MQWVEKQTKPPSLHVRNTSITKPTASISYIWEGTVSDLIELAIALHKVQLIRKPTGELLSYAEIVRILQRMFGVKIPNIYSRKTRVKARKKNASPLLERMLVLYRQEVEEMYK